jgi:hypothetical protein
MPQSNPHHSSVATSARPPLIVGSAIVMMAPSSGDRHRWRTADDIGAAVDPLDGARREGSLDGDAFGVGQGSSDAEGDDAASPASQAAIA